MRRIVEQLVDDLSGEPIGEGEGSTVTFGLDGTSYEIDLSAENARALREALAPYIEAGRPLRRAAAQGAGRARRSGSSTAAATGGAAKWSAGYATVREWAQANGIPVSPRGRVADDVMRAFEDAHR